MTHLAPIDPEKTPISMTIKVFGSLVIAAASFTGIAGWKLATAVNNFSAKVDGLSRAMPAYWTVADQVQWAREGEAAARAAGIHDFRAPDPLQIVRNRVPTSPNP